jgi:hypothetical protein
LSEIKVRSERLCGRETHYCLLLLVHQTKLLAIPDRAAAQMPPEQRVRIAAILTTLIDEALHEIAYPKGNGHADGN